MKVYFKRMYIVSKMHLNPQKEMYHFNIPIEGVNVEIELNTCNGTEVIMYQNIEVSIGLFKLLQSNTAYETFTPDFKDELGAITQKFAHAIKEFIFTVKYMLDWTELDENRLDMTGTEWSIDKVNWVKVALPLHLEIRAKSIMSISPFVERLLQNSFDNIGWKPFIALKHLHRAKDERDKRQKWINATIAAELAIKEFYIRYKPELATLLLEMPSPPLHKLYGQVLESFFNERSPYVSQIAKGVEIRNKLVHRPIEEINLQDLNLNYDTVEEYVVMIQKAIFHLLSLLYGKDYIISQHLYSS